MPRAFPLLAALLFAAGCSSLSSGSDPVRGKTMHWIWTKGPTLGTTHEHRFHQDGSMEWSILDGPAASRTGREKRYESVKVDDDTWLVSYLSQSGFTVTVALNFGSGRMAGFASNAKEWHPVEGRFEVVR